MNDIQDLTIDELDFDIDLTCEVRTFGICENPALYLAIYTCTYGCYTTAYCCDLCRRRLLFQSWSSNFKYCGNCHKVVNADDYKYNFIPIDKIKGP